MHHNVKLSWWYHPKGDYFPTTTRPWCLIQYINDCIFYLFKEWHWYWPLQSADTRASLHKCYINVKSPHRKQVYDYRLSRMLQHWGILIHRYIGVHLNNGLDWTLDSETVYKKGQRRLIFWGCSGWCAGRYTTECIQLVVRDTIFYTIWGSGTKAGDTTKLDRSSGPIWTPWNHLLNEDLVM